MTRSAARTGPDQPTTMTQDELVAEMRRRFGADPMRWAFACPSCGDVATGLDFRTALAERPRTSRDGSPTMASDLLGQECIGRVLGALEERRQEDWKGRGCDWCAYGLFRGPLRVTLPNGKAVHSFHIAEAVAR